MLSEDTTSRLLAALREHCTDTENCHEKVNGLVREAAAEARTRGVSAEQFVIWVKRVWESLISQGPLPRSVDMMRAREVIVSSAIKAYYVQ